MSHKTFKEEDIKKLIEQVRNYLKESPLKGWAYIQSQKLTEEQRVFLKMIWPKLKTWEADAKLLQEGAEKFEFSIEKEINKVRRKELKKLCKDLFG